MIRTDARLLAPQLCMHTHAGTCAQKERRGAKQTLLTRCGSTHTYARTRMAPYPHTLAYCTSVRALVARALQLATALVFAYALHARAASHMHARRRANIRNDTDTHYACRHARTLDCSRRNSACIPMKARALSRRSGSKQRLCTRRFDAHIRAYAHGSSEE